MATGRVREVWAISASPVERCEHPLGNFELATAGERHAQSISSIVSPLRWTGQKEYSESRTVLFVSEREEENEHETPS